MFMKITHTKHYGKQLKLTLKTLVHESYNIGSHNEIHYHDGFNFTMLMIYHFSANKELIVNSIIVVFKKPYSF